IQVTLAALSERDRASHDIALAIRPMLTPIAEAVGASLKVVEVPPGPPVLASIVAEVYGPSAEQREQGARDVLAQLAQTDGVVDIDSTLVAKASQETWHVNRERAAQLGVSAGQVVHVL